LESYRITAGEDVVLAVGAAVGLVRAVAGEEAFREMAWAYQRAQPSRSGNLYFAGARLADYLDQHLQGTPDQHLIDVARLEWACQECLVAPDEAEGLDLPALATVPAHQQPALRFRLHPTVRLVATAFPVYAAWQALQAGGGAAPVAPAGPGAEQLLVQRQAGGLWVQRLTAPEFQWLTALEAGAPLEQLVALESAADPASDARWLARWAARGVIHSFLRATPADS